MTASPRTSNSLVVPVIGNAAQVVRNIRNELGQEMPIRPDMSFVLSAFIELADEQGLLKDENNINMLKTKIKAFAIEAYS